VVAPPGKYSLEFREEQSRSRRGQARRSLVVSFDDLGGRSDEAVEGFVAADRKAIPDEGQHVESEALGVDDSKVADDHAGFLQPSDAFGDSAGGTDTVRASSA